MRSLVLFVSLLTFFAFVSFPSPAQILNDRVGMALIQKGINHIYNNEFEEATLVGQQVQARYPDHPVTYFLKAFQLHWQYLPIKDNKAKVGEYAEPVPDGGG